MLWWWRGGEEEMVRECLMGMGLLARPARRERVVWASMVVVVGGLILGERAEGEISICRKLDRSLVLNETNG